MKPQNTININSEEPTELIDKVLEYVQYRYDKGGEKWIDGSEAMKLLGITSKTTLQLYRDSGKLRFSKINSKTILYDRESVMEFIESNARDTF